MKRLVSRFMVKLVIEAAGTMADIKLQQLKSNKKAFLWERSFYKKSFPEGSLSCEGRDRTYDLRVMSPTSYRCSTSRCIFNRNQDDLFSLFRYRFFNWIANVGVYTFPANSFLSFFLYIRCAGSRHLFNHAISLVRNIAGTGSFNF